MDSTWSWTTEADGVTEMTTAEGQVSVEADSLTREQILGFIFGSVGFLGNLFVLVVIMKTPSMRKVVTTYFIMHQSLVDAIAALVLLASLLPQSKVNRRFSQSSTWDQFVCRVWLSDTFTWSMFMISSLSLTAISLERMAAVWKPLWHKVSFTKGKRAAILAIIWIIGIIIPVGRAIPDGHISENGECIRGVYSKIPIILGYLQVCFEFVLPVLVFIISYGSIVYLLHKQSKNMAQHNNMMTIQSGSKVHGGKNVIKTMALICILFVLCWTPNEVYYIMYLSGVSVDWEHPFYYMSVNFVFVNCCCNPFVYILKYKDFQKGVRKMFHCWNAVGEGSSNSTAPSAQTTNK